MAVAFILFITGTSGSGKTTLYKSLKGDESLKGIEFHDIDEEGVPPVGRSPWRNFRVEALLFNAIRKQKDGVSSIICGITIPHEVFESRHYNTKYNAHFLLIEASRKQVRERLAERVNANPTNNIFDESFNESVKDETIWNNLKLRDKLSNSVMSLRNGYKIDSSRLSKQEMHDAAKKVISGIKK